MIEGAQEVKCEREEKWVQKNGIRKAIIIEAANVTLEDTPKDCTLMPLESWHMKIIITLCIITIIIFIIKIMGENSKGKAQSNIK